MPKGFRLSRMTRIHRIIHRPPRRGVLTSTRISLVKKALKAGFVKPLPPPAKRRTSDTALEQYLKMRRRVAKFPRLKARW